MGTVMQGQWRDYCRLMRIDKPIGSLLLMWPTLWALWLASGGMPPLKILIVFVLGVFFMRAAGCVINDYADRKVDGHVKRTAGRPLPSGAITSRQAKMLFGALVLLSFCLVLLLNGKTILLSLGGLALAWIYPFVKRVSNLPQVVLGAAFGWAIPMAYMAVSEAVPLSCWLLFLANICWTVAYDTQYAMVDRDDDLRIGVKSTAILFGRYDNLINGLLQLAMLALMATVGHLNQLGAPFYWSLLLAACLFVHQQKITAKRQREQCFQAFRNINYVGMVTFIGILLSYSMAGG